MRKLHQFLSQSTEHLPVMQVPMKSKARRLVEEDAVVARRVVGEGVNYQSARLEISPVMCQATSDIGHDCRSLSLFFF